MTYKRKLIEVALPLEAINRESAREKSIRHGKAPIKVGWLRLSITWTLDESFVHGAKLQGSLRTNVNGPSNF